MLRALLIYLSKALWARKIVTRWDFARRAASRFVAGEELEDAIGAIRILNANGIQATLDHLGENTSNEAESRQAVAEIIKALNAIAASNVRANVSIKLTQIGLALDEVLCLENLRCILGYARSRHSFIRIDMEDSPWVDQTLRVYSQLRTEGFENTGVVIQSYLFRSTEDVNRLMESGTRIRLCKGAYKEPPSVAYPSKKDVDLNYDKLAEKIIEGALAHGAPEISVDGKIPPIPAIASHDPQRLVFAKQTIQKLGLPKKAIEFQMLHGIRRDLQIQTAQEGYPVRVYVPYGTEWYPYFVRRLAERPANLWFFVSNFFRK